ncbi:MAG: imelysin family protein [Bacteroidota bacterium]
MTARLGAALGLLALLALGAACDTGDDGDARADVRRAMLSDMATRVITPVHAQFVTDATALETTIGALDANPTATTLASAQQAWRTAARSWPRLAALNLPGVKFGLYHNRIATRPANVDAVTDALSSSDPIDLAFIQSRGSNARGLPALEYLLFAGADPLADLQDERRRAYALAISEDIRGQAEALETKWSATGGDEIGMFVAADTEGRNLQSSVSRIVNEIAMVAEDLRHIAIGRPMGIARNPEDPNSDPRPELVEAPYAQESIAVYRETLAGLRALMTSGDGTGLDDYLVALDAQIDGQPVGAAVLAQIDETDAAIGALDASLRTSIETDPEAVRAVYDEAGDLLRIVKVDMANWLGVSITFSDNDGDSG